MTHILINHWTSDWVHQEEEHNSAWSECGLSKLTSLLKHIFPVAHVDNSLWEENCIVINHQEDVIKVLLGGLHFPVVESDGSAWANKFNPHRVVMSVLSWNGQLEGVEAEHDGTEGEDWWYEVPLSIAILSNQVVVREAPKSQGNDLVENNSSVDKWVEGDSLGSSNGPPKEWVSQDAVNE